MSVHHFFCYYHPRRVRLWQLLADLAILWFQSTHPRGVRLYAPYLTSNKENKSSKTRTAKALVRFVHYQSCAQLIKIRTTKS